MEINFATCTEEELGYFVAFHLASEGLETILGGVSFPFLWKRLIVSLLWIGYLGTCLYQSGGTWTFSLPA